MKESQATSPSLPNRVRGCGRSAHHRGIVHSSHGIATFRHSSRASLLMTECHCYDWHGLHTNTLHCLLSLYEVVLVSNDRITAALLLQKQFVSASRCHDMEKKCFFYLKIVQSKNVACSLMHQILKARELLN